MKYISISMTVFLFFLLGCSKKKHVLQYHYTGYVCYEWIEENRTQTINEYDKNGKKISSYIFRNHGAIDTPYKIINRKIEYDSDTMTGEIKLFYPNGNLKMKLSIKHGLMDGIQYQYFSNGKIEGSSEYSSGVINGIQVDYYANGKIESKGLFHHENKYPLEGYTYYDSVGRIRKYVFFDSIGEPIYMKRYDKLGAVIYEEGDSNLIYRK